MPSFPSVLPELLGFQIIFALEVFTTIYLYKKTYLPKIEYNNIVIFTYFLIATIFSLLNDAANSEIIVSDFFELLKPLSFILFYWLYRYSYIDVSIIERNTIRALWYIFIFLSIWSILSFIFPSILYPLELLLYKRENMLVHRGKAIGSFSQTYHFAYTLLLPIAMSFIVFIQKTNLKYFVVFLLLLGSLLLTQSRSMYLCTAICLFLCICIPINYRNVKTTLKTILLISSFIIIMGSVVLYYFEDISKNLSYAVNGLELMMQGENNSVNIRQSQVQWVVENNPYGLIGAGIGKGVIMLESFYALYYYRYGIIGIALSLIITLYTALIAYKIAKKEYYGNRNVSFFYYSLFIFYLITPLATSSSCHMDSPKISFLFYGLMGLVYAKYSKIKYHEKIITKSTNSI